MPIVPFHKLKNLLLDLLFPIFCVGCKKEKTYCCDFCLTTIPLRIYLEKIDGNYLIAAANFQENSMLAKLIHLFKYTGAKKIGVHLSYLLPHVRPPEIPDSSILVPVPLHKKRFNDRGYNQSAVLAHGISKNWGLEIQDILQRTRNTPPQAKLSKEKRLKNVRDAFSIKSSQKLTPDKTYLLVDDVYTTGTTLHECAKVLKKHGAQKIGMIVIGRA